MKEEVTYDEIEDQLTVKTTYDAEPVRESNKRIKNDKSTKSPIQYSGDMVHAARFHEGDIVRLKNMGYNLLSPDPEEVRRALVYVQNNEPDLLLVNGKPFTKQRVRWV